MAARSEGSAKQVSSRRFQDSVGAYNEQQHQKKAGDVVLLIGLRLRFERVSRHYQSYRPRRQYRVTILEQGLLSPVRLWVVHMLYIT